MGGRNGGERESARARQRASEGERERDAFTLSRIVTYLTVNPSPCSQAGMVGFTKSLAREVGRRQVRYRPLHADKYRFLQYADSLWRGNLYRWRGNLYHWRGDLYY